MLFHPNHIIKKDGKFTVGDTVRAISHPSLNKPIFKELWHNFTLGASELNISETDEYALKVGSTPRPQLDGFDYAINIDSSGIYLTARSEKTLIQGFFLLLDLFRAEENGEKTTVAADACSIKESARIKNRMVHFCIFPETELWELQRFIRFCAALRYTHIILEFWGMLKYDCLAELSWPFAYTKEQIKPIIAEANDLGLEIVPMFNHWGHASASRSMHGKHVVLDQNPTLQPLFTDDGWCWNISSAKTKALLREIRRELIEICGEGEYFHIGCDEADGFTYTEENMQIACDYINELDRELEKSQRRAIAWADMFIYKHQGYSPDNSYYCGADSMESESYMLSRLNKRIVLADWQYLSAKAPIETAINIKSYGFDCLLCPWDRGDEQIKAVIDTVSTSELFGFIHTTWHTLSTGMPYVGTIAIGGYEDISKTKTNEITSRYAALLRRVMPIGGDYKKAGWSQFQVSYRW